ncbi:MAG: baseplate assembly protein, partial [Aquiluna sp.]
MVSELTVPNFIDRAPDTVETEVISLWETLADKTLYPGQAERLLINLLTYRETLLRVGIQYAAEQNLVNLADGVNLDQLGALVGAPRLGESSAQTTLRFTLAASRAVDTLIPAGTRARVPGATVLFQTDANATITAGNFTVDVIATAGTAGVVGNDYTAGQIDQLLDPLPGLTLTVSNTTTSSGGADVEADDPYRERIKLAPSQFSVAGPADAYKFHTLSVSQTIIDASVVMPLNAAGGKLRIYVDVYPLTSTGLPSAELITAVQTALDNNQIRPLCDIVTVKTPTSTGFTINADITILDEADAALIATQIDAAITAYIADRESELGQDIITSQIVGVITGVPGVYDVTLNSPASDIVVTETEWA